MHTEHAEQNTTTNDSPGAGDIVVGLLRISLEKKQLTVNDVRLHLTGKEFQVLEFLALRLGQTVTKEMFLNHLYGGIDEPELKIIDVFICRLRKKIQAAANGARYIETVWGRGYTLVVPQ